MICPYCGKENTDEAVCSYCKAALPKPEQKEKANKKSKGERNNGT